jgi:hypothetical protein
MSVITIPFDYNTGRYRRGLVPICIPEMDEDGHPIAHEWFQAVVPVAEYLRHLARRRLRDVWRVSELAELAVHAQWRKHRYNFGTYPHRRISEYARWTVEDLRCGHVRLRKRMDILLGDGDKGLIDPLNYQSRFDCAHDIDQIRTELQRLVSEQAARTLDMLILGFSWEEIASSFGMDNSGRNLNLLRKKYSRAVRRVLPDSSISLRPWRRASEAMDGPKWLRTI